MSERMVTRDGRFRVTGKQLGERAVLHVEARAGRATDTPCWVHVGYCDSADAVARLVDNLSELVKEGGGDST